MKKGFTLAEVLITLGIIGVVAAMTLPTLINKTQKRELEVATQKFYSTMSQAVQKYMADEGVSDLRHTALAIDNYDDAASDEAVESIRNFVTKYLKVVKECDNESGTECFANTYKMLNGDNFSGNDFGYGSEAKRNYVLADGSVIRITYTYGPIELYVDVNGKKGPNKAGYDLWSMSIYYDGVIDESHVGPECRKNNQNCWGANAKESRENHFESCKEWSYGGCFGHFMENGFKFDY